MLFKEYLERYNIDPKEYLHVARVIAQKQGYDPYSLTFSNEKNKKLEYAGIPFGSAKYKDFIIYSLLKDPDAKKRRNMYRKRATKVAKETDDKYSPANLSLHILW